MGNNDITEIVTVGNLIEYLKSFPTDAPVLKSDMLSVGYNRFYKPALPILSVCYNPDTTHDCAFIDAPTSMVSGETPGASIQAVVL